MHLRGTVWMMLVLGAGMTIAQNGPVQPDPPAARDFSGKWVQSKVSTLRDGRQVTTNIYLILKQAGNQLTGEVSNNTIRMPGDAGFAVRGWVEGNDLSVTGYVDFQGGETTHIKLSFKDGHLVGSKESWHDAPHKWRLDDKQDLDYTREP